MPPLNKIDSERPTIQKMYKNIQPMQIKQNASKITLALNSYVKKAKFRSKSTKTGN